MRCIHAASVAPIVKYTALPKLLRVPMPVGYQPRRQEDETHQASLLPSTGQTHEMSVMMPSKCWTTTAWTDYPTRPSAVDDAEGDREGLASFAVPVGSIEE